MSAPYRKGGTAETWVWVIIVFLGIACQLGAMFVLHPYQDQLQAWILVIAIAPFVLAVIIALIIMARMKRKRIAGIKAALESKGLAVDTEPTDSIRAMLEPHMTSLNFGLDLRNGSAGLQWIAYSPEVLIFEHEFTTGSGRYTQVHNKTVVAYAKVQERPWMVAINRRFGEAKLYKSRFGEDIEIGEPQFDKQWLLYGSEGAVNTFMSLDVRMNLADSPKGEGWYIDSNWVVAYFPYLMNGENVAKFVERAERIINSKF